MADVDHPESRASNPKHRLGNKLIGRRNCLINRTGRGGSKDFKLMMSIYLSRSFPRSNSGFFLCSGNVLQSAVLRLREEIFLVDAGLGTPRICMQDEPTGAPINRAAWLLVGSTDVVAGEPLLILPRRFRQNRAWMELNQIVRTNKKVKGFIIEKAKGGYSVAIAGFITFLPFRPLISQRISNDRFTIESIHPKRTNIVVF